MAYRALARTYRSNTFDELVGQDAVTTTLKNAIETGRVHHGYIFTGTRGVGKTSMARILAKSLNCAAFDAPTTKPCLTCDSCIAVALGDDIDVVEIDAASNNGVDNIRELRSNATLHPARSRYKIYIIDEVHMLSPEAFNALLKTLEEPPPHVKFILATTEIQKIPATILSRCQRFDFRAINAQAIADQLAMVASSEKVTAEPQALRRIARLANGSMRDALSLLDKVLSYESVNLTMAVLDETLPPPHDELAAAVIDAIAESDAAAGLRALDAALQTGQTVDRFCDQLIDHMRTLMLLRVCGSDSELVDVSERMRPKLAEQAEHFDAPTYVYMISLLEELRRNVKFGGAHRALADATVIRLAMSRHFTDINTLLESLDDGGSAMESGVVQKERAKKKETVEIRGIATRPAGRPAEGIAEAGQTTAGRPSAARATGGGTVVSADLRRAAADPLVRRITEAVEGTLFNVRPAEPANDLGAESAKRTKAEAGENDEDPDRKESSSKE